MLKIARRLGLGSPEAPSIPSMQVVDHRFVELKSSIKTIALCHKDSTLYVASYEQDLKTDGRIVSVDLTDIYPSFRAQFALYREKSPREDVYVKRTQILELVDAMGMSAIHTMSPGLITTHEASICDRLSFEAHPNIVEYLGVQVSDELDFDHEGGKIQVPLAGKSVTGLVFKKYDCILDELVIRRQKFDVRLCLKSVSAAIQHLHRMNLVHGDLSPHNIFVKRGNKGDHFVLGDFSSAHNTGSVITFKTGDNQWKRRKRAGIDQAEEDDDWSGFRKLTEWLVEEMGGKVEDYKNIEALARR